MIKDTFVILVAESPIRLRWNHQQPRSNMWKDLLSLHAPVDFLSPVHENDGGIVFAQWTKWFLARTNTPLGEKTCILAGSLVKTVRKTIRAPWLQREVLDVTNDTKKNILIIARLKAVIGWIYSVLLRLYPSVGQPVP